MLYIYIRTYNVHMHIQPEGITYVCTVPFNYNFIFTCVYTSGTTKLLHCIPVTCLCGPRLLIVCNMHVSCNLHVWKYMREYTRGSTHVSTRVEVHACTYMYRYVNMLYSWIVKHYHSCIKVTRVVLW